MRKRTKESIDKHKEELIKLYMDQLEDDDRNTTFMKAVLNEAIRQCLLSWTDPKKIEDWVVKNEKAIYTTKTFKL